MKFDLAKYLSSTEKELHSIWSRRENLKLAEIEQLAERIQKCFSMGGVLAFMGNGGSAAEANHLAAEFVGKCVIDHPPLRAISLTSNDSILTAISNDYSKDEIFSRQVEAFLNSDSIIIGMSTSGKSTNVLKALNTASLLGAHTVLWTGKNESTMPSFIAETWNVTSSITPRIQEVHLFWGHLLAEIVEREISSTR